MKVTIDISRCDKCSCHEADCPGKALFFAMQECGIDFCDNNAVKIEKENADERKD